ncbi:MAG: FAD:protein FMN transferase [Chloroflexi bacterium]|nr:FAD:protein FMN transferase [Chloroflexota bacterium]
MQNYSIQFKAMGSHMQVWLSAPSSSAAQILAFVPDWFETWEAALSRFRPGSELSTLNARSGEWVMVSDTLFENIEEAKLAAEISDGIFNPLILNALEAAGYEHSFDPGASGEQQTPARAVSVAVPSWQQIQLDQERRAVCLPAGARIDLGGIAKGWAAQAAADRLFEYGPCLVDAGGDLVAHGSPDENDGWIVKIPTLDEKGTLYHVLLVDESAASSGTDYRQWQRDGQTMHHLIDPRTGRPAASDIIRSTVIAPDATEAVVWAKVSLMTQQFSEYPTLLIHRDGAVESNWEVQNS